MNRIEIKIKEMINILERQDWTAIEFETIGTVSIKFVLHKPKYRLMKKLDRARLYDKHTDKKVIIDLYTATDIYINEDLKEYEIQLGNDQFVKLKMI